MKKIIIVSIFTLLTNIVIAQIQMTVTIISDPGVKKSEYLDFALHSKKETDFNFKFEDFSTIGETTTSNLYQHSGEIDQNLYLVDIKLKSKELQLFNDTLIVDKTILRIELFVYVGSKDSLTDYIREIKILQYKDHPNYLNFSVPKKLKIGSKAMFNIKNLSEIIYY